MIAIHIRVSNKIDMLQEVVSEAAEYEIWPNFYGENWAERVNKVKNAISGLYSKKEDNSELEIHFSFFAAQILKRLLLYYIRRNFFNSSESKKINFAIDFLVMIEEHLEDQLMYSFSFDECIPNIKAWNK